MEIQQAGRIHQNDIQQHIAAVPGKDVKGRNAAHGPFPEAEGNARKGGKQKAQQQPHRIRGKQIVQALFINGVKETGGENGTNDRTGHQGEDENILHRADEQFPPVISGFGITAETLHQRKRGGYQKHGRSRGQSDIGKAADTNCQLSFRTDRLKVDSDTRHDSILL